MTTKTICRKCNGEILDGQLDASLDGCSGEHTADDCRRGQLRDDYEVRLRRLGRLGRVAYLTIAAVAR